MTRKAPFIDNFPWLAVWLASLSLIIALSIFGRQLLNLIKSISGSEFITLTIAVITFCAIAAMLWLPIRNRGKSVYLHLVWLLPLYVVLPFTLSSVEERIHFPLFAVFGFASLMYFKPAIGIFVCIFFAGADELLQWYLPNRVGDLRDWGINAIAGLGGAVLAFTLSYPRYKAH